MSQAHDKRALGSFKNVKMWVPTRAGMFCIVVGLLLGIFHVFAVSRSLHAYLSIGPADVVGPSSNHNGEDHYRDWQTVGVWALMLGVMLTVIGFTLGEVRRGRVVAAFLCGVAVFGGGRWLGSQVSCVNGSCRPRLSQPKQTDSSKWQASMTSGIAQLMDSGPPSDLLPALVPFEPVLGQSDQAVIQLQSIRAYRGGWSFSVLVRTKRIQSILAAQDDIVTHAVDVSSLPATAMRFRIVFADGRSVDNVEGLFTLKKMAGGRTPTLDSQAGDGSDSEEVDNYTSSPLPPAGPLYIECEWPAMGISLTRTPLDSAQLRTAANHAVKLW